MQRQLSLFVPELGLYGFPTRARLKQETADGLLRGHRAKAGGTGHSRVGETLSPLNPDDAAITTAIINMAKSLNLKVIAEGVEDEAQMSFLRHISVTRFKAITSAYPLAVDEVAEKLRGETVRALAEKHEA